MAAISPLKCCLASSILSSHRKLAKDTTSYSSQAKSKQSITFSRELRPLTFNEEDNMQLRHTENLAKVKGVIEKISDPLDKMIAVDRLQRLGIDYHFKEEIGAILDYMYEKFDNNITDQVDNLFEVSQSFRLLRQAGYSISSDVFNKFIDKRGEFKASLSTDKRGLSSLYGLLSLYEASHLNTGEEILNKANGYSGKLLTSCLTYLESEQAKFVEHSLKHPCHMTVPRYNARHYLSFCERGLQIDSALKELARLDFSLIQLLHQSELEQVLRWWNREGLARELRFARDQPLKWYIWSMTIIDHPRFSKCRIELTKVIALIYIIDDIFDVYGSVDELLLFTKAISRWELTETERLPRYMQICYTTLYDITNEIAALVFKETSWNPINSLKKSWSRLCNAFMLESLWLRSEHVPKSDEYLRNAMLSTGVDVVMVHMYFLLGKGFTKENVSFLESFPTLISCPATILRLRDDLGSAKDESQEGFDGSYLHCHMKEHPNSSPHSARDHVKKMIYDAWQNLNKESFSQSHFTPDFVTASLNFARMVEVMYDYDGEQKLPILEEYINMLLFKGV